MDVGKMKDKEKMNVNKKEKTGLVLEGGGLRGIFTAGVLDSLRNHFASGFVEYVISDMHVASTGTPNQTAESSSASSLWALHQALDFVRSSR